MQDREPFLPEEFRAALRAPVELGAGARARVMQRVRAVAVLGLAAQTRGIGPQPRGMARPSVVGALLAASFVAALLTGGARSASDDGTQRTLADTIAMHFAAAADAATNAPAIDRTRLVAVADETRIDETRNPGPRPHAVQPVRRD